MHRFAEEGDRFDVVDSVSERVTIEIRLDVTDGVLIRTGHVLVIVVDAASITELEETRRLEVKSEIRAVDFFQEPEMPLSKEIIWCVCNARDRRELFHWLVGLSVTLSRRAMILGRPEESLRHITLFDPWVRPKLRVEQSNSQPWKIAPEVVLCCEDNGD
ncbi:hypothetical protein LC1Hm_0908 [Halomicrobium sp. LC1Hm]|nr:hypothetical protein LC1Hm_0908 [Halomicrobium sp. LC1Hm]